MCVNEREREREKKRHKVDGERIERERERVWRVLAHGPAHGTSSVFVCVLFVSEGFAPLLARQGCC